MRLYRMITGPDDNEFCHRISKALSNGWELAGSASLTYDPVKARVICGNRDNLTSTMLSLRKAHDLCDQQWRVLHQSLQHHDSG